MLSNRLINLSFFVISDHRQNTFGESDHWEWVKKRAHVDLVNGLVRGKWGADGEGMKVVNVYNGLFLDMALDVSNEFW